MILTILIALAGAALGAFLRPRILAVIFAAALGAASRAGPIFLAHLAGGHDDAPNWAGDILRFMETPFTGYLVLTAIGAGAAMVAAMLCLLFDDSPSRAFWMPQEGDVRRRDRNGKFKRAADMIEERAIHSRAEANIRANFDR